jgi:hypothetical protein
MQGPVPEVVPDGGPAQIRHHGLLGEEGQAQQPLQDPGAHRHGTVEDPGPGSFPQRLLPGGRDLVFILSSFIIVFSKVNDCGDLRLTTRSGPGSDLLEPVTFKEGLQLELPHDEPPAQILHAPFPLLITDQGHDLILLADYVGVLGQHVHPLLPRLLHSGGGPPRILIESLPSCGPDLVSIPSSITIVIAGVLAYEINVVFIIVILIVFIEKRPSIPILAPLRRSPGTRAVFFVVIGLHVVFQLSLKL